MPLRWVINVATCTHSVAQIIKNVWRHTVIQALRARHQISSRWLEITQSFSLLCNGGDPSAIFVRADSRAPADRYYLSQAARCIRDGQAFTNALDIPKMQTSDLVAEHADLRDASRYPLCSFSFPEDSPMRSPIPHFFLPIPSGFLGMDNPEEHAPHMYSLDRMFPHALS